MKSFLKNISSSTKNFSDVSIFVDSNIITHWLLAKGGLFDFFIKEYNLSEEFKKIYLERYKFSIEFLDYVSSSKKCYLFFSQLAFNEIFSSIKSEFLSLLLFKSGIPISKWSDPRINPEIRKEELKKLYFEITNSLDKLYDSSILKSIHYDASILDNENFLDVYSFILFLFSSSKTHDAILLTTAIFEGADFFITSDLRLIKDSKKIKSHNLKVISPKDFMSRFKNLCE